MSQSIDEAVESFTITYRREIIFYLQQLINDGDPVSVSFNEGHDTILTILLGLHEDKNLLYFDWGSSEDVNRRFLRSERNFFVAMPHGVRNQFVSGQAQETTFAGRPAFMVTMPDRYVRLQRREFFRLVLPMTKRPLCVLVNKESGKSMKLEVVDIGVGGLGLNAVTLDFPLDNGTVFDSARIELKGVGELVAPLEIRHTQFVTKGSKTVQQIGCRFTKLSAAQENLLQRFMSNIQREERARLGG